MQKTISGMRKWLSERMAFVFSYDVICVAPDSLGSRQHYGHGAGTVKEACIVSRRAKNLRCVRSGKCDSTGIRVAGPNKMTRVSMHAHAPAFFPKSGKAVHLNCGGMPCDVSRSC